MKEHRRNTGSMLSIITLPERIHCVDHHALRFFDRMRFHATWSVFFLSFSPLPLCCRITRARLRFPIINQVSLQSGINNPWLMMQRWMPFPANSKLFCHKPSLGGLTSIFIGRRHHSGMTHSHPHWQGVKTCKIFSAQKLEVHFSRTRSSSNEFIGYVDLSDFYEIWPKWSSDIGARKCVGLFKNSKYCYFDASLRVAKRKIFYWSTSKFIFSKTNRKILKARHTLVAYRVLIEIVRFVWLCVIMRRWVIQQSEHVWFWVWSLARAKKAIINFKRSYIRILHFITFSVIYSLLEFYRK